MGGTMSGMTDKKRSKDRHKTMPLQLRLPSVLRRQLEILAERNLTNLTTEAIAALRSHLEKNGLWPPNQADSAKG